MISNGVINLYADGLLRACGGAEVRPGITSPTARTIKTGVAGQLYGMKSRNARYTGNGLFAAVKAVSIFDALMLVLSLSLRCH
jgi:hypothetical protein